MSNANTVPPEELQSLRDGRTVLAEQQKIEQILTELLDETPPANWRELASGALTEDV